MKFGSTEIRDLFSLFPACAGVILNINLGVDMNNTVPRMRGGDPLIEQTKIYADGCSPHARG